MRARITGRKAPNATKRDRFATNGCNVDLVQRKVYEVWPDPDAERHGQIRVVDESGEEGAARLFRQGRLHTRPGSRRAAPKTRR